MNDNHTSGFKVDIQWKTIIKILLGVLLAFVAVKLWPVCKLVVIAILVAMPLSRLVSWACRKGWGRWAGLALASATLIVVVLGLFALLGPTLYSQAERFRNDLPKIQQKVAGQLSSVGPLQKALQNGINAGGGSDTQQMLGKGLNAVKSTLGGMVDFVLVLILAIYFISDGPRALRWIIGYFRPEHRERVSRGLEEIGNRIVAYTIGQSIISAITACYVFLLLTILHVPMAPLLGVIAGILDIIPVIGFLIAVCLTMLVGLTVSPTTPLLILAFYGAYHLFEDYYLIPKVYGNKLRLSNLAVLLSITVGLVLAGVFGAVVALPLVAAYPALEQLWLGDKLEPHVLEEHERMHAA